MTRPIHSVKHLKSSYKKFQVVTMVCAVVTIVLLVVTSISNLQIGRLINNQKKARSDQAAAIASDLNAKLKQSSRQVSDLNAKISEMGTTIKALRAKNADLQKQLSMAKQPPAPVINEETSQGEATQPNLTPGSVQPPNTN